MQQGRPGEMADISACHIRGHFPSLLLAGCVSSWAARVAQEETENQALILVASRQQADSNFSRKSLTVT